MDGRIRAWRKPVTNKQYSSCGGLLPSVTILWGGQGKLSVGGRMLLLGMSMYVKLNYLSS